MKKIIILTLLMTFFVACNGTKPAYKVEKEPIEEVAKKALPSEFSIVLNDMDVEETEKFIKYKHKYTLLKIEKDSLVVDSVDWKPVSEKFFLEHENDLGMEILSYHNGKLNTVAKPVGYDWAVGNTKEGKWEMVTDSVNKTTKKVWRPRVGSMLFWYWMMRRPASYRHYNSYGNFRGKKPFYGHSGSSYNYGTRSKYEEQKRSGYYGRVRTSSAWTKHRKTRTRKTSRYRKSSSTRGRSGGFGK
jgi:hypothetical protein